MRAALADRHPVHLPCRVFGRALVRRMLRLVYSSVAGPRAVPCYAMLCYAMLCYAMRAVPGRGAQHSSYAMLRYAMPGAEGVGLSLFVSNLPKCSRIRKAPGRRGHIRKVSNCRGHIRKVSTAACRSMTIESRRPWFAHWTLQQQHERTQRWGHSMLAPWHCVRTSRSC
jgi:hypothetical protein